MKSKNTSYILLYETKDGQADLRVIPSKHLKIPEKYSTLNVEIQTGFRENMRCSLLSLLLRWHVLGFPQSHWLF